MIYQTNQNNFQEELSSYYERAIITRAADDVVDEDGDVAIMNADISLLICRPDYNKMLCLLVSLSIVVFSNTKEKSDKSNGEVHINVVRINATSNANSGTQERRKSDDSAVC